MIRTIFAAALALGAITGAAQAVPLGPYDSPANSDVIAIAGGCGAGWHRGPYGVCRGTGSELLATSQRGLVREAHPLCGAQPHDYGCRNRRATTKLGWHRGGHAGGT